MSLSLVRRCRICDAVITDDDDYSRNDDPELCELCQDVIIKEKKT